MKKNIKKVIITSLLVATISSPIVTTYSAANEATNYGAEYDQLSYDEGQADLVFNTVEEYVDFISYSIKNGENFPVMVPRSVGVNLDSKDARYFWTRTKAGKCISNIVNPKIIAKSMIFGFSYKELKKKGLKWMVKRMAKNGVSYATAYDVMMCMVKYYGK